MLVLMQFSKQNNISTVLVQEASAPWKCFEELIFLITFYEQSHGSESLSSDFTIYQNYTLAFEETVDRSL